MKKVLSLVILISLFFVNCLAEDFSIGSYKNGPGIDGKTYSASVRLKDDKIKYVYVFMATGSGQTGYFCFGGKDLNKFYDALCAMKEKFVEWSNTAVENNITSFSKEFDVKMPKGTLFWGNNKTWLDVRKTLKPTFMVVSGKPVLTLIGGATATTNKYISETFNLVFMDINSYNDFVEIFNPEAALKKALELQGVTKKFE